MDRIYVRTHFAKRNVDTDCSVGPNRQFAETLEHLNNHQCTKTLGFSVGNGKRDRGLQEREIEVGGVEVSVSNEDGLYAFVASLLLADTSE